MPKINEDDVCFRLDDYPDRSLEDRVALSAAVEEGAAQAVKVSVEKLEELAKKASMRAEQSRKDLPDLILAWQRAVRRQAKSLGGPPDQGQMIDILIHAAFTTLMESK